jgi:(2S)-methylsuccinyl-CoA dehydrogenase
MTDVDAILSAVRIVVEGALAQARDQTGRGERIDDHQVLVEKVAYAATELRAAEALRAAAATSAALAPYAAVATCELAGSVRHRLADVGAALGIDAALDGLTAALRTHGAVGGDAAARSLGRAVIEAGGRLAWPLDPTIDEVRASVRQFAEREIAPHAEHIHRHDELVPERFIREMSELGYFGLAIPESYGGHELGNLAMILTTEELSRASLAGAGSLITRPEILAKALLAGGTEAQKQHWLPRLASGETMVAISVTEPNVGSDVAAVGCRAEPATVGGVDGYVLRGAKAWCTFAGRADIIAVLARTDPDPARGAKGLSLFIVDKPRFEGHEFAVTQPTGGTLTGTADRTPGYRGMHSFTLAFDGYFVPKAQLVGEAAGLGRGFYLQMAGFAAGRLQTGGRACGLAQAALEVTARYARERGQFGQAIAEFGLTQYYLGVMAARLAASRAITYAAAAEMDRDERVAAPLAAQAKLLACDMAVWVSQQGQVLHGGWGYAEEYPISRYVVDALVLPIFEGVRPILTLKVVARALLA